MPGELGTPGENSWGPQGVPNTIFRALQHGYVVVAPAIRGRIQQDGQGRYTGKAPACIVDYKAAVRYLRHFAEEIPGDTEKIITNGTSAGGALSSLMGATGNHPDYEPYLEAIGAARERDDIFMASCYCPIINLENADAAYEWQFAGVNDYRRMHMQMDEGGRPEFVPKDGQMSELQIRVSGELAKLFQGPYEKGRDELRRKSDGRRRGSIREGLAGDRGGKSDPNGLVWICKGHYPDEDCTGF